MLLSMNSRIASILSKIKRALLTPKVNFTLSFLSDISVIVLLPLNSPSSIVIESPSQTFTETFYYKI